MIRRNYKVKNALLLGKEYCSNSTNRAVKLFSYTSLNNTEPHYCAVATLYGSALVVRGSLREEYAFSFCGWDTRTSALFIRDLMPAGWQYSRRYAHKIDFANSTKPLYPGYKAAIPYSDKYLVISLNGTGFYLDTLSDVIQYMLTK